MAVHNIRGLGILFLFTLIISGCGSNSAPNISPVSTLEASQDCINCHESTAVSSVTNERITDAWQLSSHNTASSANFSGRGASCGDCHEPEAGHPNSCNTCHGSGIPASGPLVQHNPDRALKCDKCHTRPTFIDPTVGRAHFSNVTAAFVSTQFKGKCRSCHDPHNPSKYFTYNEQWAASGKGDSLATPWNRYDFKSRGTTQPIETTFQSSCVRCHTATGYINYVTSGLTNVSPWGAAELTAGDRSKQTLACPACHDDGNGNAYSFKVRQVSFNGGGIRVYYNYSAAPSSRAAAATTLFPSVRINNNPFIFPDAGTSNLCVVCHSGRAIGQLIKDAAAAGLNFDNVARINAHDFVAGGSLFQATGYEYTHLGRSYTQPVTFQHDNIGLGNFQGTGSSGPCITCHMSSSESHLFLPVTIDSEGVITQITGTACIKCHVGVTAWSPETLQEKKTGYLAALTALYELQKVRPTIGTKIISGETFNPDSTVKSYTYTTKWASAYGGATGADTMGASFNFEALKGDSGAFAHNSAYTRKLIYDSLDWVNDGTMNNDVASAILGLPATTRLGILPAAYRGNYRNLAIAYLIR
ncbi:cytochrome C [Geobacter pelophilus]|uniref:Cytochrome C n=1 Tax=Geoanaerobacter pelophilus TaxID=60036 RepID=A0AAW4KXW6_9BACT|nr:cytochrome C [Geoanaerobacter pelophilus]MBT0663194.1 cytochrome C [Geoanaerobacter pelophilus]